MTNIIDKDFLREIKGKYETVRNHRIGDYLEFAAATFDGTEPEDGRLQRNYIDAALQLGRGEFEIVLREILMDPRATCADRTKAAILYVHGHERKHWRMSPWVEPVARKLIRDNMEAIDMPVPEKTKADLAREAGVPNETFVYKVSTGDKSPVEGRTSKQIVDDFIYVQQLSDEAELIAARKPTDLDALGVAFGDYLAALKRYFPKAYEAQTAQLRKQFAPVVAKTIVDLVEKAPATASAMLEIIK